MKIYVDVSETVANQLRTGIQRVVREVVAHSEAVGKKLGVEVVPVVAKGKYFYQLINLDPLLNLPLLSTASAEANSLAPRSWMIRVAKRILKLIPFAYRLTIKLLLAFKLDPIASYCSRQSIQVESGVILLLLDSFWSGDSTLNAAANYRRRGGVVVPVVYDLIPISYSQYCDAGLAAAFVNAFPIALSISNSVLTISNAVADEIRTIIAEKSKLMPSALAVDYFYLGADFSKEPIHRLFYADNWPDDLWEHSTVFMMVGTVEPRKGHEFVLDAFEQRWRAGSTEKLLILGKVGWKTEMLINRIVNSPYYGVQLFMVNQATDTDLKEAYQRAYACIMASYAEGFGLPIIEAQQQGVPVIASDIPVFREIAGNDAEFFSLGDVASFNKAIDTLQKNYKTTKAKLENYKWLTWEESTEQLLRKVIELSQQLK